MARSVRTASDSAATGPRAPAGADRREVSPPAPVLPADLVEPLRADLAAAGFTVDGVADLLGPVASAATRRDRLGPARRVLDRAGATPAATVVRLFTLGDALDAARLDAAFPRVCAHGLERIGLVRRTCGGPDTLLRAACDLRPYGDEEHTWWVASDLAEVTTGRPLLPDHVLGVGGASLTLAAWTPRPRVGRVLDLGTGCGVQALHAATHSDELVATDLSERALAFAAFNAALAGQHWDLRQGDLFAPVGGVSGDDRPGSATAPERFDLVVSNPPFVITPRDADLPVFEYRDGGREGDALVESFVRGVGAHLAPDGVACFLADWETRAGGDWRDRWREWLDTPECAGLDAWVLAREYQDPAEYAELWARDGGHLPGTPEFDVLTSAWLDDFESRDVEAVWFGIVLLHRPEAERSRWVDLDEVTGPVDSPMGPYLASGLAARTRLHTTSDEQLFATAWVAAPDVTEERHARPGDPDPSVILLRQGGGLRRAIQADTALSALVSVCDGDLTGDVAVTAIAALTDEDPDELRRRISGPLRRLVADGLLVPAGAGEEAGEGPER
ncbi:DUF7059 domain-containing protein [Mobilicoccus pelagius]|uniref:Uncharacterized protein n=1 Tax=Mobilicoccus pelagius NBRC 104925 TaxID=1089455 RepID=H5UNX3_9MICO|nr:methyltransferase [Mobilicoccus pelagius]GAB47431.1 hypothetical protein MOPEL_011_00130 [Mobilicoccus pelagius NBRC 104925]